VTLILTCLTHKHIVQAADRRLTLPDGSLYDDDTNKAVFYCGSVAVAYTGLARMEGMPTAEWIGRCMKDAAQTESAMKEVASQAERHLRQSGAPDKRLAVVATGWGTLHGKPPIRPFICVASNFLSAEWNWEQVADDQMVVRTKFLNEDLPYLLFPSGQNLCRREEVSLSRSIRRAVEHRATATALARHLGETIQSIAGGGDARAARVGRGMIIHLLSRTAPETGSPGMILTPLTPDAHSFIYVSREGRTDRFQGAVIACNGLLVTGFGGGTIPAGGKGRIRTEMEESARRSPIRVPPGSTGYSAPCPLGAEGSPTIVEGELPMTEEEAWIYCRGQSGHLLLVQRERL